MITEKIKNKRDFITFVLELRKDFKDNPESWENRDIDAFLEALAAWVDDMDGYYLNIGEPIPTEPSWRHFADMLMGASVYE